jgi:hypothetical protein
MGLRSAGAASDSGDAEGEDDEAQGLLSKG